MHGLQHYEEVGFTNRTLEEEQENDRVKYEMAMSYGIDKYIIIDCRESEFGFIWNNICDSLLSEIFDLEVVDVQQLAMNASKSLFTIIVDMWQAGCGTTEIINKLHINRSTALDYLHSANDVGIIVYSTKESRRRSTSGSPIAINQYTKDGCYVISYRSAQEMYDKTGIDPSGVRKCCRHNLNSFHGYLWFNADDPTQPDKSKIITKKNDK